MVRTEKHRGKRGAAAVPSTKEQRSGRRLSAVGLFAGVGGIELGLSRAGHVASMLCEIEETAVAVLKNRFAGLPIHRDVCTLERLPKSTDLIVGGFPCQDLSQAGKTVGIAGSRSGLVGEVFRLLRTHRVPLVVLENVPFMLQLSRGRALDVVIAALEDLDYKWAYRVVDTRAFGLPQRRRRVLIVAALDEDPRRVLFADEAGAPQPEAPSSDAAFGFYWTEGVRGLGGAVNGVPTLKGGSSVGVASPPAIWLPDGRVVTPEIRDAERLQGFAADWTKPAEAVGKRGLRWKLVGNAVSVPVAKWLGTRLANPADFDLAAHRPLLAGTSWPTAAWNVGEGRHAASISEWPKQYKMPRLEAFLRFEPQLLSPRATAGFIQRAKRGSLHFPEGFLDALDAHLRRVSAAA